MSSLSHQYSSPKFDLYMLITLVLSWQFQSGLLCTYRTVLAPQIGQQTPSKTHRLGRKETLSERNLVYLLPPVLVFREESTGYPTYGWPWRQLVYFMQPSTHSRSQTTGAVLPLLKLQTNFVIFLYAWVSSDRVSVKDSRSRHVYQKKSTNAARCDPNRPYCPSDTQPAAQNNLWLL